MEPRVGDVVQTPLGKGTVREHRRNGSVVVLIGGRAVVVAAADVTRVDGPPRAAGKRDALRPLAVATPDADAAGPRAALRPAEVDLHGLTVEQAVDRAASAVDAALRDGRLQLRLIHGRSGGRIRAAVHRLLREVPSAASFRLDPQNPGVTIIDF